jgi:hypothetical protein
MQPGERLGSGGRKEGQYELIKDFLKGRGLELSDEKTAWYMVK